MLPSATLWCRPFSSARPSSAPRISNGIAERKKTQKWDDNSNINSKQLMTRKKMMGFNLGGSQLLMSNVNRRSTTIAGVGRGGSVTELDDNVRKFLQVALWATEAVYIVWLFLLPYAPGDPVWAISSETINSLIGLSLNFFFVLPFLNAVGVHLLEGPVLHPMSEGLFNFVIAWTLLFAPLLYTDRRRNSYKGSLDVLWGFQMFLTNTFLIPYMALRLNKGDETRTKRKTSPLGSVMINGASVVGLTGAAVCLLSVLWAIYGRADGDFGNISERLDFLVNYLGSERLAYAFIWDIVLYTIFQPWLIGENLQNIRKDSVKIVSYLRFVPVVGLVAYCICLNVEEDS
ncbi:OLC1v1032336C1 [Oldenlandia corymbosa var. corymbosa]|uniref:OLC1v1032336C1 n=1 Tax=Oldenlandia corymbosa var. corymbosa TaxID=529605 RepID=A0AAV1CKS3_OLDCO|nr:OLC1v1032336C1 [Oldenlandia corymbosa var. corymbosa]